MIYYLTLGLSQKREKDPIMFKPLSIETISNDITEVTEEEIKVVTDAFQGQIKRLIESAVRE